MKLPDRRLPKYLPKDITPPLAERPTSVHPNTVRELEELIIKAFYLAHDIAGLAQNGQPELHNINTLASMVLRQWAITQGTAIDGNTARAPTSERDPSIKKFG